MVCEKIMQDLFRGGAKVKSGAAVLPKNSYDQMPCKLYISVFIFRPANFASRAQ